MNTTNIAESRWPQATEDAFSRILFEDRSGYLLFWIDDPESESCRKMAPLFHEFAEDLEGQLRFVRIDFQRSPRLAAALGMRSAPAIALVSNQRVVRSAHGELVPEMLNTIASTFFVCAIGIGDAVSPAQLGTMVNKHQVIVMDVRDVVSFRRAHISGAISASDTDPTDFVAQLARTRCPKPIVFYDRYDGAAARKILEIPKARGLRCGVLAGGFIAWEGAGLPIERS